MPTCNKVNCAIVLPPTDTPLPEYRRKYLDSSVSVYIPVPDIPILHAAPSFNIQLWTDGYIAPGLAMFVYIDGYYQCNRSKRMPPPGSAGGSGIEMTLRQKEEKVAGGEGDFVGREWRWVSLDVDKANEATNADRETQDRIGKIEVVVLRCDDDELPALERQMRATQITASAKAPEKAPSTKAPSAKAPSTKPPSAMAPSAVSGGLGGLFGLFEGACDALADRVSNENSDKQCYIPIGLDGQEYEHPHTIVDQYGRPYNARTPYYHNFSAVRPENTEHRRNVNANVDYISTRGAPIRALGGHRPETGYTTAPVLVSVPPYVPQQQPSAQRPRGTFAPAGQPYLRVYDQPQPRTSGYHAPAQNYIDPASGIRHAVQDGVPGSYIDPRPHSRPIQVIGETPRVPAIIDPEFQRFQIFKMAETIERLLDVDHRFVAAAAPYMTQLKATPIENLGFEEMRDLKRDLHRCLDRGCYPNGEAIKKEFNDPRDRRSRSSRRRSSSRRAESSHRHAGQSKAGDGGGKVMSWIKESNKAESKHDDRSKRGGSRDRKSQSSHRRSQTKSLKSFSDWSNNGANAWPDQNDTSGEQNDQDNNDNNWGNESKPNAVGGWDLTPDKKSKPSSTKSSSTVDFALAGMGAAVNKNSQAAHHSHHSKITKSTDPHAYVQPYFETWRGGGQNFASKPLARQPREACPYPPASAPHITSDQVGDRSHGVRAGKGADYTHRVRRPKYLDTMEDPYAVFVFNYRSAEKLEEILHQSVQADLALVAEEVGRGVLMNLPREKLVEELMKTQAKAVGGGGGDAKTSSKTGDAVESKVKSAAPSVQGQKVTNNWGTAPAQGASGQGAAFVPDGGGKAKDAKAGGGGWQPDGEGVTNPQGGW